MISTFDKNLLPEFDSIKDDDEIILWTGKPLFVPYIFSGIATGLFTLAFGIVWVFVSYNVNVKPDNVESGSGWSYFWLFGLIPLAQGFYVFANKILSFSNTAYCYSNKRIMIRTVLHKPFTLQSTTSDWFADVRRSSTPKSASHLPQILTRICKQP